jgi:two-component system response regulator WspF
MRIAIVNDTPMAVEGLRRVVQDIGGHSICWIAWNGLEAVENCLNDKPDLILMDLVMPQVDGVEATHRIMQQAPCPILVVTASVDENTSMVFEAMGKGALDAVNTPVLAPLTGNADYGRELLNKVSHIGLLKGLQKSEQNTSSIVQRSETVFHESMGKEDTLVVIGGSSGGPHAIAACIGNIPKDFNAAIVIVQHVDEKFAPGLVKWLDSQTELPVRLAQENDIPKLGEILVAGRNEHLTLTKDGYLYYSEEPREMVYRPSVDVFWKSVASHWQGAVVAVLLTGMGKDGALGMLELKQSGAYTIAQDEQTSAVFGMPKAAIELEAATNILPLNEIGKELVSLVQHKLGGCHVE